MNPELTILLINLTVICVAVLFVYPQVAKDDLNKLMMNDLAASIIALLVAASLFMGKGIQLSLIFIEVNWFWFCLLSYMAIETPFMMFYLKRYGMLKP